MVHQLSAAGDSRMVKDNKLRKIRLNANPTAAALADLHIGDIVYLDGTISPM